MKIAFYKAEFGTKYDKIVSFLTRSPYSHCEIVLQDGKCWSASMRDGGVRSKYIDFDGKWDLYDLPEEFDEIKINYWFSLLVGNKYDYLGAVASWPRIDLTSKNRKFCSQISAMMLGIESIITPGRLFRKLKSLGIIA